MGYIIYLYDPLFMRVPHIGISVVPQPIIICTVLVGFCIKTNTVVIDKLNKQTEKKINSIVQFHY